MAVSDKLSLTLDGVDRTLGLLAGLSGRVHSTDAISVFLCALASPCSSRTLMETADQNTNGGTTPIGVQFQALQRVV